MTERLIAFPPILPVKPHTLILGTMPGEKSLEANEYYAHPQNQFWKFMGDIYGAEQSLPYTQRIEILKKQNIAVWDVLQTCIRKGSMDSDIKNPIVNDFANFYNKNPTIALVVFNSLVAEKLYKRLVLHTLTQQIEYRRVPSPSPANARLNYADKLALWKETLLQI